MEKGRSEGRDVDFEDHCETEVEVDGHGMANVQDTVGFRRESSYHLPSKIYSIIHWLGID